MNADDLDRLAYLRDRLDRGDFGLLAKMILELDERLERLEAQPKGD